MKKYSIFALFIFISAFLMAIPRPKNPGERLIRPNSVEELDNPRLCELDLQTNVTGAEVYINDYYEGRTDLLVRGLRPGYYSIELKKNGYETEYFAVELRPGYRSTYRIDMVKITGKIYIHGLSENTSINLDGASVSGSLFQVDPGYHTIELKRFGYEPYFEDVYVEAYEYTDVYPEFTEAAFEVYDFAASRTSINPDYDNVFSKVDFSFTVTSNGSAELQVLNQNEEIVWKHKWNRFTTWNQSISFNGKGMNGEVLPDGTYLVKLLFNDSEEELPLILDSSVSYILMGINTKGAGIGSLPVVFNNDISLIIPYLKTGYVLNEYRNKNFLDIQFGLLCDFSNHFEINLALGVLPGGGTKENKQVQFSTSVKVFDTASMGIASFCYGALVHCSFVGEPMPLPAGVDNGSGLGFALMAGIDFPWFYLGYATDYIFASDTGRDLEYGSVWKNGIAASIKAGKKINIDGWFALNSAINNPYLSTGYKTDLLYAVDYGAELLFTIGDSSTMGDLKVERQRVLLGDGFYKFSFGLSYLL